MAVVHTRVAADHSRLAVHSRVAVAHRRAMADHSHVADHSRAVLHSRGATRTRTAVAHSQVVAGLHPRLQHDQEMPPRRAALPMWQSQWKGGA